jgi:outer membrane protein OmpA-like peptidoglycan-associated protein
MPENSQGEPPKRRPGGDPLTRASEAARRALEARADADGSNNSRDAKDETGATAVIKAGTEGGDRTDQVGSSGVPSSAAGAGQRGQAAGFETVGSASSGNSAIPLPARGERELTKADSAAAVVRGNQEAVRSGGSAGGGGGLTTVERTAWEKRPYPKWWLVAPSAAAIVGLVGWQMNGVRSNSEDELQDRAALALRAKFPKAKLRFHGRDAMISGITATDRRAAHDLVRNVEGVRNVREKVSLSSASVSSRPSATTDAETAAAAAASVDSAPSSDATSSSNSRPSTSTKVAVAAVPTSKAAVPTSKAAATTTKAATTTTEAATTTKAATTTAAATTTTAAATTTKAATTTTAAATTTTAAATTTTAAATTTTAAASTTTAAATTTKATTATTRTTTTSAATSTSQAASSTLDIEPAPEPIVTAPDATATTTSSTPDATSTTTSTTAATESASPATAVDVAEAPVVPLEFGTGSCDLSIEAVAGLDQIVAYLTANPTVRVDISGHADSRGTRIANLNYSTCRADAVRNALVKRGIGSDRLNAAGFGSRKPIASNATADGRDRNRRVDLKYLGQRAVTYTG